MTDLTTEPILAPTSGPYSPALKIGNMIFVSGQIPIDLITKDIPCDVENQIRLTLKNLMKNLKLCGAESKNVVNTKIYITDMDNFDLVNKIYGEYFAAPYPTRTCIGVSSLPKNVKIMIDAIAILS